MKTSFTKTMLLVMIAMVSIMMAAQIAKAGIKNTKHDLSSESTGGIKSELNDICVFCHTPHNANAGSTAPLWNRNMPTATGYTLYTGTMKAAGNQPAGVSAACLSCHDGSVALDSLYNSITAQTFTFDASKTSATTKTLTGGTGLLGRDLSNDHPISMIYGGNSATGLVEKADVITSGKVKLYGVDDNQTVECASCHSVHDNTYSPFLRMANTGSLLCLECHNK